MNTATKLSLAIGGCALGGAWTGTSLKMAQHPDGKTPAEHGLIKGTLELGMLGGAFVAVPALTVGIPFSSSPGMSWRGLAAASAAGVGAYLGSMALAHEATPPR